MFLDKLIKLLILNQVICRGFYYTRHNNSYNYPSGTTFYRKNTVMNNPNKDNSKRFYMTKGELDTASTSDNSPVVVPMENIFRNLRAFAKPKKGELNDNELIEYIKSIGGDYGSFNQKLDFAKKFALAGDLHPAISQVILYYTKIDKNGKNDELKTLADHLKMVNSSAHTIVDKKSSTQEKADKMDLLFANLTNALTNYMKYKEKYNELEGVN
ncbi:hypothetical protein A0H76_661 [Hepatospora eriocheir]|uniref:Uncharacterized protein n=1 Tax=Hepatospora eriocheir TaxID=1081669 RepID=A0A1X0QL67_9MICR|nr:hypothetical protein A0H76_661 [Hepatospora eriocheir]